MSENCLSVPVHTSNRVTVSAVAIDVLWIATKLTSCADRVTSVGTSLTREIKSDRAACSLSKLGTVLHVCFRYGQLKFVTELRD